MAAGKSGRMDYRPDSARGAVITSASSDESRTVDTDSDASLWVAAADEFTAWRAGDGRALERLVRLLNPTIWQVVRSCGLDRYAAEDVVQTTWFAFVRYAETVRDARSVLRWLTVSARREAWRVLRETGREEVVDAEVLEWAGPTVPGPEAAVLADSTAGVLWRNFRRLSQECQRFLRFVAFGERPNYASLAEQTGRAVGGMGPTRGRCLEKLRRLLSDDPEWSGP